MGAGSRTNANVTLIITNWYFMRIVIMWLPQLLSTWLAASLTSSLAGAMPVSRSTIAAAASLATPCTFAMAADRVAAMVFIRFGDATGELCVHFFAARLSGCRRLFVCFIGQCLRTCAGIRQCLFTGQDGGVGLVLAALRFRKIGFDAFAALLQNRADQRQRYPRHQQI